MYSSAILLKYLTLKFSREAYLYHQVPVYDHIIAYDQLAFIVMNVKVMINYLAAREFRHAKRYFNIMSSTIHASGCAILYSISPHLAFIMLSISSFYHTVGSSAITQACLTSNYSCSMFIYF